MSNGSTTWTFTYDANGMRTQKSNGTTTYKYVYNGSSLSQMTVGNDKLYFAYDANGTPMSVTYNGTTYYYVTNIQGDIIAILNSAGSPVVTYTYDAWGNPLTTTGTMAATLGTYNPLRYRGYVYDQETQFYYLQSRYYNPEIGRFLNADAFVSTGQGLLGNNMFAYCLNNPVNTLDIDGFIPRGLSDPNIYLDGGSGGHRRVNPNVGDSRRNVTNEIQEALETAVLEAKIYCNLTQSLFGKNECSQGLIYYQFYKTVNHNAAWDIKRPESWETTIGTPYPGFGTYVDFSGINMTPEQLGNFTYGILGYVYGIPCEHLIVGSYYAANFPMGGLALENEISDWFFACLGYEYAMKIYS